MTLRATIALTSLVLAVGACQPAARNLSDADVTAIRQASATYVRTALAKDADGWMALFAEDAVYMPPNHERLETRQALSDYFAAFPPTTSLVVTPVEIFGREDLAFARGTYSFTIVPEGAAPVTDSGDYVEIWRKGPDGMWRLFRDIYNSERPLNQ